MSFPTFDIEMSAYGPGCWLGTRCNVSRYEKHDSIHHVGDSPGANTEITSTSFHTNSLSDSPGSLEWSKRDLVSITMRTTDLDGRYVRTTLIITPDQARTMRAALTKSIRSARREG